MRANADETTRLRLTKSSVAALKPHPDGKIRIVWDRDMTGFGVRIMPSGVRSYFLQRRTKTGRGVKVTIGRGDRITAEQARERARELIAQIDLGRDPAAELETARETERTRKSEWTVAQLFDDWLQEHAIPRKRSASVTNDKILFRKHVEPAIGRLKVPGVTTEHIRRLHGSIEAKYAANRALALISALMNYAMVRGLRADNPTRGVKRNPEHRRERFLSVEELGRLLMVFEKRDDLAARCLTFMAVTGARRGETLAMTWSDVDLATSTWSKRPETTKSGKRHQVPLSLAALQILAKIGAGDPARRVFAPLETWHLRRAWSSACAEASITNARQHDLRHAFVTTGIAAGVPPAVMVQLAGHHDLTMTSRYAHPVDHAQRAAAQMVAERYEQLVQGNNVVRFKAGA